MAYKIEVINHFGLEIEYYVMYENVFEYAQYEVSAKMGWSLYNAMIQSEGAFHKLITKPKECHHFHKCDYMGTFCYITEVDEVKKYEAKCFKANSPDFNNILNRIIKTVEQYR